MQFYLAPMEAVTGFVYRNVYESMFGEVDTYFAPFITPTQKKILKTRERKDVAPEHNVGIHLVPQILTNDAGQMMETCRFLAQRGYQEVNINLGCPAATVVTKGKGSGLLADPERLEQFLSDFFAANDALSANEQFRVSVKTRLGMEDISEFKHILEIYNSFPLQEVIIHPRVRSEFYNGIPHLDVFEEAMESCKAPVCYNGDIWNVEDYRFLKERFPKLSRVMLGRGVVANPGLVREIKTGTKIRKEELRTYHDALYEGYLADLGAEKDVFYKMKELWFYLGRNFADADKAIRAVQKSSKPEAYKEAVREVFTHDLKEIKGVFQC
ncbi:MAG: tRNA-dihydrouridine synthase family protein [Lachnospiraceae bacterium]|nr:tRNA-dihydrouridine synthase family protein [Lachnospiraceae bacterium]